MADDGWQDKWLFDILANKAVCMSCKRTHEGWLVNLRPNCERSKLVEHVPASKVYDSKEDAEGANPRYRN